MEIPNCGRSGGGGGVEILLSAVENGQGRKVKLDSNEFRPPMADNMLSECGGDAGDAMAKQEPFLIRPSVQEEQTL